MKLEDLAKELEKEIKRDISQVRFAATRALNETAFKARTALIVKYEKAFTVRSKTLPKKVEVKKATKQDMVAQVGFPFDWMEINVKGGTKRPSKKKLSTPIGHGEESVARTASGKILKSFRPANLLKYADGHKKKKRGEVATSHAFKMRTKNGNEVIARRKKGDRKEMEWLYVQKPAAKVPKRWDFPGIVGETVNKYLNAEFEKAMQWAKSHPKK